MDTFEDFIKKKAGEKLDVMGSEDYVSNFNQRVTELHDIAKSALVKFEEQGLVTITMNNWNIQEEDFNGNILNYDSVQMKIALGQEKITLNPVGYNILGALGRVDMDGPRGKAVMLLSGEGGPKFVSSTSFSGMKPPILPEPRPLESLVWNFMVRVPRLHYIEVNLDTFQEAFMKVVNG